MELKIRRASGRRTRLELPETCSGVRAATCAAFALGYDVFDAPWCLGWETSSQEKGLSWLGSEKEIKGMDKKDLILAILPMSRTVWN